MSALTSMLYRPRMGYHLLRVSLALLMLAHGIAKVVGGVGPITGMVAAHGLPAQLGYAVYLGEVVAPLLVLAGVWVGPAALVMAVNMVVAIALAHASQLFSINPRTGGHALELQALYLFGSLALAFLAPAGRSSGRGAKKPA